MTIALLNVHGIGVHRGCPGYFFGKLRSLNWRTQARLAPQQLRSSFICVCVLLS